MLFVMQMKTGCANVKREQLAIHLKNALPMGDGERGVHGAIVQSPVVVHNILEKGVAIPRGQLRVVQIVLARILITKTAMLSPPVVCNILPKLNKHIFAIL